MARKKRDPAAEDIAKRILAEYSPKTADEAQEALRSVFGPMIETMLKAELEAHLGYASNDKSPKEAPTGATATRRRRCAPRPGRCPSTSPATATPPSSPPWSPRASGTCPASRAGPVHVRARHVAARHSRHRARDIRLLDERGDRLGHHRPDMGGAGALALPPPPARLRLHVRGLTVRAVRRGRGSRNMAVYAIVALRPGRVQGRAWALWMQESEGGAPLDGLVFDGAQGQGRNCRGRLLFVSMDGVPVPPGGGGGGLEDGLARRLPPRRFAQRARRALVPETRLQVRGPPPYKVQAFCLDARDVLRSGPRWRPCRPRFGRLQGGNGRATRGPVASAVSSGAWRASCNAVLVRPRLCAGSCTRRTARGERQRELPQGRSAGAASRTRTRGDRSSST